MKFKSDELYIHSLPSLEEDKQVTTLFTKFDRNHAIASNKNKFLTMGISLLPRYMQDRSKYMPHIGKKEIQRRIKQNLKNPLNSSALTSDESGSVPPQNMSQFKLPGARD